MPKISIIVPVYKVEKYIGKCIDSILAQTYSDFELILVNDGSPDNSGAICDEYAKRDSRVRVFHKLNGGVSSARNKGLREATGEWVYFVDSDDYIDTNTLWETARCVSNETDLVVHGLIENRCYDNSVFKEDYFDLKGAGLSTIIEYTDKWGLLKGPVCKLFKKDIVTRHNLHFDESISYGEDTKFTFEYLSFCDRIEFCNQHFYHYCFYGENSLTTQRRSFDFLIGTAFMLRDIRNNVANRIGAKQSYYQFIYKESVTHIYAAIIRLFIDGYKKEIFIKKIQEVIGAFDFECYRPSTLNQKVLKWLCLHPIFMYYYLELNKSKL